MTTQIGQGWLVSPGWGFGIVIQTSVVMQYLVVGGGGAAGGTGNGGNGSGGGAGGVLYGNVTFPFTGSI